nr:MAG TPA: hypothetical protein [Caudoviricetes sp.]
MKVRLAKKIMNYYKRFYGSKYWLWRWGLLLRNEKYRKERRRPPHHQGDKFNK